MAIGLGDIYEKLKELVTITDKVRKNTDRIVTLEEEVHGLKEEFRAFREESRLSNSELRGDIKAILIQLKTEERMDSLEAMIKEHIAVCEKAKA
ncbi:MAG: hypothetical protein ABOK23_13600 [Candidatus Methanoperedens sp.]|nr:hypothetical protein [Candidatus Methanoperedens sp.]MCZ7396285.1 hypothetical protein [Candidatus Methanoperedens sp.]